MIINLSDPLWCSLFAGLLVLFISLGITGVIKFSLITHQKKLIEDSFFRLRAELELVQKENQKEIAELKQIHKEKITNAISHALDLYDKKLAELLKHNQPLPKTTNALRDLYLRRPKPK